jgi:DNA modification methylase
MNDLEIGGATVLLGDCIARLKNLPEQSVQMCVTSPPYFGLRDYGHDGQLGLEATPEGYVANMVAVFREVRRVLADDGTLWLNIGDSYARNPSKGTTGTANGRNLAKMGYSGGAGVPDGIKEKDLIGIPWMLAFALRADGWYLRQDIIWHKPNPMPESVTDRCTKSHESLFLLSKSPQYFYDAEAVKEEAVNTRKPGRKITDTRETHGTGGGNSGINNLLARYHNGEAPTHRNRRSVWTIATRPYKGAHFATFPPALVEPCILAGTSVRGHCPRCGSRWARMVERPKPPEVEARDKRMPDEGYERTRKVGQVYQNWLNENPMQTIGWSPTCDCGIEPASDVVLDPFNGSGTTGQVALQHGRRYVGIELNPEYVALTRARLELVVKDKAAAATPSPQSDLFAAA